VVVGRNPTQLLVTASGKHKGWLQPSDFVLVDQSGQPVFPDQPKSSAETLLHCLAAEDEDVGAVLHTHSVWSTLISARYATMGGVLIEGFEMLKGLSGVASHEHSEWFPIFPNSQDIPALADQVRAAMKTADQPLHGFLIHQHGIYTWGRDLDEAFRHIEIMEFLFEVLARQASLK
jgi:methylthioribulose-1-phosphate dehydratase